MATALKTLNRRALKGVIRDIELVDDSVALISVEIDKEYEIIATELPAEEVQRLNLQIGDVLDIIPVNIDTYLIIGKPKH